MVVLDRNMIERFITVGISAGSIFLFCYWFRYACILILSAQTTQAYARQVSLTNQLGFPAQQSALHESALADLDRVRDSLDRDYAMITGLLNQVADASGLQARVERCMLKINYRLMRVRYGFNRRFSARAAHRSLQEMLLVVAHFANSVDGCAA